MRRTIAAGSIHVTPGDGFLDYLKSIEAEADPIIPAFVRATYGEDWLKPYVTMFAPRKPNA